jgi:hypothetical protein
MTSYLIFVPPATKNKEALLWLLRTAIIALNLKQVRANDTEVSGFETVHVDTGDFHSYLTETDLSSESISKKAFRFNDEGVILSANREDELLTAFYLINCLQEYNSTALDAIGRFEYESSYQKKFNKTEINFATTLLERYFSRHLPKVMKNRLREKSSFFLSHDVDSLYGAFLQDGLAALKHGRLDIIARLILNTFILKPDWFNIDKIIKIESEYDLRSTYFWIVKKGRVNKVLTNADYDIRSKKLQETLALVQGKGNCIGLHKSVSNESFDTEVHKLNKHVVVNRNHYLKFTLPDHFKTIEASPIKIECSLGFAEHYGFRNSLAIPFVPFNCETGKPHTFLEVPLNVMDGTFQKYMKLSPQETTKSIIGFIEKNNTNSVISVLWHNHFFSSYRFRGYFEPYKDLLNYIKENGYNAMSPGQLFNKYYHLK